MAASVGRRIAAVFLFSLMLSASLIFLDRSGLILVARPVFQTVVTPVAALTRSLIRLPAVVTGVDALQRENEMLRNEVKRLMAENVGLQELRRENERLRAQLGLQETHPGLELLPAEVVSRDSSGTTQVVAINRGSRDRVSPGMAVIAPEGLVGRVTEVGSNFAKVLLIIDISSSVNAVIEESGADGIVVGQWQAGGWLKMRYIQQGQAVKPGDKVVTSGLGGGFPRGLLIGQVVNVGPSQLELSEEAEVRPAVDFAQIRLVSVVISQR